jgi:hypothetical protein
MTTTSMLVTEPLVSSRRVLMAVLAVLFVVAVAATAFAVGRATVPAHPTPAPVVTQLHAAGPADLCRIPRQAC